MARVARVVWTGCPFHATQRGNRGGTVFFSAEDRRRYLEILRKNAQEKGLRVWAYALMTNHVHLVVVPEAPDSMARAIGNAHRRHAQAINHRKGWTGHLWANRFYSTPMDDAHLWSAVRYVELNPVRAGIVHRANDYPWSSARAHVHGEVDPILDPARPFPGHVADWASWLHRDETDPRFDTIRRNTSTGRPTGSEEFIERVEHHVGRSLRPARRGRKPSR